MVQYIADRRDIDFVIWEQLDGEDFFKYGAYKEFNRKTCDMITSEARSLAIKFLSPTVNTTLAKISTIRMCAATFCG